MCAAWRERAGAAAGPERRWRSGRRAAALALACTALLGAGTFAFRGLGNWLVVADLVQPVDAAVVLSGRAAVRVPTAARLYRDGLVQRIVLTSEPGPSRGLVGFVPTPAEQARYLLVRLGVPDSAIIVIPDPVESTQDEAEAVARRLSGPQRLALVTSDVHTRRARCTFRRALPAASVIVTVPAYSAEYDVGRWWRTEAGLLSVTIEMLKTVWHFPC